MLAVKSAKHSAEAYRDKFGFTIDFIFEAEEQDHPCYAVVRRGKAEIHFESYKGNAPKPHHLDKCGVYIMVDDVDRMYEEFKERGVDTVWKPTNQDYGIRDFKILDPDGYQLLFGTKINSAEPSASLNADKPRE